MNLKKPIKDKTGNVAEINLCYGYVAPRLNANPVLVSTRSMGLLYFNRTAFNCNCSCENGSYYY
jgi:hypothetical protein